MRRSGHVGGHRGDEGVPGVEGGEVGLERGDAVRGHELRDRAGERVGSGGAGERGERADEHQAGGDRRAEFGGQLARRDAHHAPAFVVVGPRPRVGDDERVVDQAGERVAEECRVQHDGRVRDGGRWAACRRSVRHA